jgi:hypothetical protein
MEKHSLALPNLHWKRWAAGAAGVVGAYTLAGFWLVPHLIKDQLPKIGQSELERKASIGEVRFNPYTLRLEAQDLRLAEADGAPLFALGNLAVELQWSSLFKRAWIFTEISVTAPSLNLAIAPDGKFNINALLATLDKKPHEPSTGMPRLIIERFSLEQGKVELHDRQAGYDNSFAPMAFALTNFSTLPEHNGAHTFSADLERGGKLRWKGDASLEPIRGAGELTLQDVALPELTAYLKPYTHARVASGKLNLTLPYRFAYANGKLDARLTDAALSLRELALTRDGASAPFATMARLDVRGVGADLARQEATVNEVHLDGAGVALKRDAKGQLDLANLMVSVPTAQPQPAKASKPEPAAHWKLALKQVLLDQIAFNAVDETAKPALKASAEKIRLQFQLNAEQNGDKLKLTLADADFSLADLALKSGAQTPFKLARFGFSDGAVDLDAHHATVNRLYAEGGQLRLTRDRKGQLNILGMLPKAGAPGQAAAKPAAPAGAAWVTGAKSVELSKFDAAIEDQGSAIKVRVQDFGVKLDDASGDLTKPLKFEVGMRVREGGQLSAQGNVVPSTGALQADVKIKQLALAPLQPLLSQHVKLKIAGGNVSAQGRLSMAPPGGKDASLRYVGNFDLAGLALDEDDGDRFAAWKSVRADKLSASVGPNLLDIPLLRIIEPNAKLIIENDRSLNAARLLVQADPATAAAPAPVPAPAPAPAQAKPSATAAADPFPVRIQRLRFENAKLDFVDLSLRPQFGAKIYDLNGVITSLSSRGDAHSQIELDGRVNEFGMARIRGSLNAFAPRDNTDINVVFKNVDMVSASPYTMKFAGYKIDEGKISLDLQYKIRNSELEGANQIVIDNLTLGERIDSPDALKLPLSLAIAILKDSDGRIDLGLPVSGNMNDPQFSYGAVVWKALGNVLSKIVTSPFRALGSLFGGSGEKLEAIDFDAGSANLLPPEREKLKQVAKILAKRAQLKLSVPGQYSEAADGAVLKTRLVRAEIAKRAGVKLESGEDLGPVDLGDRAVRSALRGLYADRFGSDELGKQKKGAEGAVRTDATSAEPAAAGTKAQAGQKKLALWQRMGKLVQGEPQVADASAFYGKLQARLVEKQPLGADDLTQLGAQRASAIVAALQEDGVDPASMSATAPEKVGADAGKPVALKLGLGAK